MNGKKNRVRYYSRASRGGKCKQKLCELRNDVMPKDAYETKRVIDAIKNVHETVNNTKRYYSKKNQINKLKVNLRQDNKQKLYSVLNRLETHYYMFSPNVTKITNDDFKKLSNGNGGTLRITKPGYYYLGEDIIFNPKNIFPDPKDPYYKNGPGLNDVGPYSLGFFAAITIETDDVILDLNNHTIAQSKRHRLKQRFFSIIELSHSPFIKNQGPFKATDKNITSANNCLIMNGTLGSSSHHGIHGNGAKNCVFYNLNVRDFEVAGIALNGSDDSILCNIKIGPISPPLVTAAYSQCHFAKKVLENIIQNNNNNKYIIENKEYTPLDVFRELEACIVETDNAILNNIGTPHPLFTSDTLKIGLDGNAYGIVLTVKGVVIGPLMEERSQTAEGNKNIFMHNINIENIQTAAREIIAISKDAKIDVPTEPYGKESQSGARGVVINFQDIVDNDCKFKNNILVKALLIINMCLGGDKITGPVQEWMNFNKFPLSELLFMEDKEGGLYYIRLGSDSMGHVMKGTIGLFISCGIDIFGENIQITNINNHAVYPDLTNFPEKTMIVTSKQINRGSEAMEILWTGCSNVDLQKVIIKNSKNKVNFLSVDKEYIKKCRTPICTTNCNFKKDTINLHNESLKNKTISFNSDDHDGDTNTNSNIEYILV